MAISVLSRFLLPITSSSPTGRLIFLSVSRLHFSVLSSAAVKTDGSPKTLCFPSPLSSSAIQNSTPLGMPSILFKRSLSNSSEANNTNSSKTFAFSDSDSDDDALDKKKDIDKSKLPPPYDPFSKKPVIEEPNDPKNLQEIFHKMRGDGLINNAIKMFDALSKDGLTHEALELFAQIKDKGNMPDVVAHTAVIEAYANAGQTKEALRVYLRMLASGVQPNAYTYTVLIKGLATHGKLGYAKKHLLEMMAKGMKPNAGTYAAVFEAFAREQKMEEGKEFLEHMKAKGFVPDEKAVRDHLSKRGQVFRSVMNMLFDK